MGLDHTLSIGLEIYLTPSGSCSWSCGSSSPRWPPSLHGVCPHLSLNFFGRTTIRCRIHIQRFHLETFKAMRWCVCTCARVHTHIHTHIWSLGEHYNAHYRVDTHPVIVNIGVHFFSKYFYLLPIFQESSVILPSPPPSCICTKIIRVRFLPALPFLNCLIPSWDSHLLTRTFLGTVNLNTPFSFNEKRNLSWS